MKKVLGLLLAVVITSGLTALATVNMFTDSDQFPDWSTDSIEKISDMGVIQGYSDGSFGPNNLVTRAELAVMLDRFEQQMQYMSEIKINNILFSLDDMGVLDMEDSLFKVFVAFAESGFMKLDDSFDPNDYAVVEYEIPSYDGYELLDGYSLYYGGYSYYLRYEGFRNFGQDGWDVVEWYGPFSAYAKSFARHSLSDFYFAENVN